MKNKHITNKISTLFYRFATKEFTPKIQNIINKTYIKLMKLDMSDFSDSSNYKTLNKLFTRELVKERKIKNSDNNFISPCDSLITAQGDLSDSIALQIKGMNYSVKELLTSYIDEKLLLKISNGKFMNFYLSPKDYHRYHSPYSCKINKLIHVPGKLYPVNNSFLNKKENLFIENERVILECILNSRVFYMVFVGALNVGQMVFNFEPKVETNNNCDEIKVYEYSDLTMRQGECLGYFKMGSTILIFWEKDMVALSNLEHKKVKFTDVISTIL